jgi:murein DD-endopeptidase MepM/ murein hydrolase activator NlpD
MKPQKTQKTNWKPTNLNSFKPKNMSANKLTVGVFDFSWDAISWKVKAVWYSIIGTITFIILAWLIAPTTVERQLAKLETITGTNFIKIKDVDVLETSDHRFNYEEKIELKDSLNDVLERTNITPQSILSVVSFINRSPKAQIFNHLEEGKALKIKTNDKKEIVSLSYVYDFIENTQEKWSAKSISIEKNNSDTEVKEESQEQNLFIVKTETLPLERRIETKRGVVEESLFKSTEKANIPDSVTSQIAEVFASQIDFLKTVNDGDSFNIVYESFYQDGKLIRVGNILAAEYINDNKSYQAALFQEGRRKDYYMFNGSALRKAFMRAPLPLNRVTSGFTRARYHPVLHRWRAHKGTDFGAPTGTKIQTVGDGTIVFRGDKTGYGHVVIVRHFGGYETLYAHMSRFANQHVGQRVEQGEIIGYVGQSGYATGPHLHFEFHLNGNEYDPLKVELPGAPPLTGVKLSRFQATTQKVKTRFNLLNQFESNNAE